MVCFRTDWVVSGVVPAAGEAALAAPLAAAR